VEGKNGEGRKAHPGPVPGSPKNFSGPRGKEKGREKGGEGRQNGHLGSTFNRLTGLARRKKREKTFQGRFNPFPRSSPPGRAKEKATGKKKRRKKSRGVPPCTFLEFLVFASPFREKKGVKATGSICHLSPSPTGRGKKRGEGKSPPSGKIERKNIPLAQFAGGTPPSSLEEGEEKKRRNREIGPSYPR